MIFAFFSLLVILICCYKFCYNKQTRGGVRAKIDAPFIKAKTNLKFKDRECQEKYFLKLAHGGVLPKFKELDETTSISTDMTISTKTSEIPLISEESP